IAGVWPGAAPRGLQRRERRCDSPSLASIVVALVPGAVLAAQDLVDPGAVLAVPPYRRSEALVEASGTDPTQLTLDLAIVDRVATVVPGPVAHVVDQRLGFSQLTQDRAHDLEVGAFGTATDVVGLTLAPRLADPRDRITVVLDVDPVAYVHPVAVDR